MSSPAETSAPVQQYSYKKALNVMSDSEKARVLCVALTMGIKPTKEDLKQSAQQHGSAEGGFAKQWQVLMRKLKDSECFIIEGEDLAAIPTPESTPAKKTPAKRKAAADAEAGDDAATPAKKGRGRPKKGAAKVKGEDEDETSTAVKADSKEPTPAPVAAGEEV